MDSVNGTPQREPTTNCVGNHAAVQLDFENNRIKVVYFPGRAFVPLSAFQSAVRQALEEAVAQKLVLSSDLEPLLTLNMNKRTFS